MPKPPNQARCSPTLTVAASPAQIARLRELAWAREVSLSHIAREAIEVALARWEAGVAFPANDPVRRDAGASPRWWPRELRRQAARDGAVTPVRIGPRQTSSA